MGDSESEISEIENLRKVQKRSTKRNSKDDPKYYEKMAAFTCTNQVNKISLLTLLKQF